MADSSLSLPIIARKNAKALGLKRYFTGRPCRNGNHIAERLVSTGHCLRCTSLRVARLRKHDPSYRQRASIYRRARAIRKRNDIRAKQRAYYLANRETICTNARNYNKNNRQIINSRKRRRKANDLQFRLSLTLRERMRVAVKKKSKTGHAVRDLGCSIPQFIEYIRAKFTSEMNWQNWGTVWELDHQRPLSSFDLTDRSQYLMAAHFTNMQPLSIPEHRAKTAAEQRRA
jgi:hypothetical protein